MAKKEREVIEGKMVYHVRRDRRDRDEARERQRRVLSLLVLAQLNLYVACEQHSRSGSQHESRRLIGDQQSFTIDGAKRSRLTAIEVIATRK